MANEDFNAELYFKMKDSIDENQQLYAGWNVGRLTAQGLCNICTPVSESSAKPGDLIFFSGTYDSGTAVSHVGIVVDPANFIMVDAGDPVKYESYNTSYWNSHFYCIGRLPAP